MSTNAAEAPGAEANAGPNEAPNMASEEANQRRHEPPRAHPRVIPIEEDSEHLESDAEEEGEYRQ